MGDVGALVLAAAVPTPQEWQAIATGFAAVAAAIAVIVAVFQLRRNRLAHEAETRPYVIVDFAFDGPEARLEVANIGKQPAFDVRVRFEPPLGSSHPIYLQILRRVFEEDGAIHMLAPGRKVRWRFDNISKRSKDRDLPSQYEATIEYRGTTPERDYADPPYAIDLEPYLNTLKDDGD